MKKILAIIGARPQFIKHAPVEIAAQGKMDIVSIHTGQHYDDNMSQVFFDQLKMTTPKYQLNIGSHSHGIQTGRMMASMEPIVIEEKPDAILVYGDTNSTLAGALVGAKLHIPIIHVEAGLRSFNRQMPEEINRVLTDHTASLLFVPTDQGIKNLEKEGIKENVYRVGDVMCDMVLLALKRQLIRQTENGSPYLYATIHRPYNTDDPNRLRYVLNALNNLHYPVKLALHPRTKNRMKTLGIPETLFKDIQFLPPVSYFENVAYQANAQAVLTDSGGMQKEAYILKKKCITIRKETEWLETLQHGWNALAFEDLSILSGLIERQPGDHYAETYGNGKASEEIVEIMLKQLEQNFYRKEKIVVRS